MSGNYNQDQGQNNGQNQGESTDRGLFSGLYNKISGVKTESTAFSGNYGNPNQQQGNNNNQQGGGYNPNYPGQNQNQGYPQNQNQGYPQNQNQGYPQNQNQGYPQNQNQGYPQNQNQGYPQNQNQGNTGAYNPSAGANPPAGGQPTYQQPGSCVPPPNPSGGGGGITIGSVIALKHNNTGRFLSSEPINYQSGSGQQYIFSNQWNVGPTERWQVVGGYNQPIMNQGQTVGYNQVIRLKHLNTNRFLHSHPNINSPVSQYQEVSGFGNDSQSDNNDNWVVEKFSYNSSNEGGSWSVNDSIALKHLGTGMYLFSHERVLPVNGKNGVEVAAYGNGKDENNKWRIQLA